MIPHCCHGYRRELERLEEAHCLAEAQRLARVAEHEAQRKALLAKEEEVQRLSLTAQSMQNKAVQVQLCDPDSQQWSLQFKTPTC